MAGLTLRRPQVGKRIGVHELAGAAVGCMAQGGRDRRRGRIGIRRVRVLLSFNGTSIGVEKVPSHARLRRRGRLRLVTLRIARKEELGIGRRLRIPASVSRRTHCPGSPHRINIQARTSPRVRPVRPIWNWRSRRRVLIAVHPTLSTTRPGRDVIAEEARHRRHVLLPSGRVPRLRPPRMGRRRRRLGYPRRAAPRRRGDLGRQRGAATDHALRNRGRLSRVVTGPLFGGHCCGEGLG